MEVLLQIIWVYPLAKGHFWILPLSTVPVACHTGWNSSPTLCPIWVGHCLQRSSFKMQTPPKEYNEVIISPVSSLLWIKLWAIFILRWKSNDPARRRVWGDVGSSRVLSGTNIGKMFKRLENTRQIWFSLQCSRGCFGLCSFWLSPQLQLWRSLIQSHCILHARIPPMWPVFLGTWTWISSGTPPQLHPLVFSRESYSPLLILLL